MLLKLTLFRVCDSVSHRHTQLNLLPLSPTSGNATHLARLIADRKPSNSVASKHTPHTQQVSKLSQHPPPTPHHHSHHLTQVSQSSHTKVHSLASPPQNSRCKLNWSSEFKNPEPQKSVRDRIPLPPLCDSSCCRGLSFVASEERVDLVAHSTGHQ